MEECALMLFCISYQSRDVVRGGEEGAGEDFGAGEGEVCYAGCAEADLGEVGLEEGGHGFVSLCFARVKWVIALLVLLLGVWLCGCRVSRGRT